jgi:hypothetical protein
MIYLYLKKKRRITMKKLRLALAVLLLLGTVATVQAVTGTHGVYSWLLAGRSNEGKTCAELDDVYADSDTTWVEFKLEEATLTTGPHDDGTLHVDITLAGSPGGSFSWTSDIGVDAIVVKDGVDGASFYVYDGLTSPADGSVGPSGGSTRNSEETTDTNLTTPNDGAKDISHISFCYDVEAASPTLATTPNPVSGTVGDTLNDTAVLSGGNSPTGSITFKLYPPADATCSGDPVFSQQVTVNGNGSYNTTTGHVADQAGTWRWTADYSGDGNNNSASSGCQEELVTIDPASPTLATTPNPQTGTVGDTLNDTAVLSGGFNPTGSITFKLYPPADATCSGDPVFSQQVTVNGNGSYNTTTGHVADQAGTWRWTAYYSGDVNNNSASSGCTEELVLIEKPTAITLPGSSFNVEANARRVTLTWETVTEVDNAGFNLYRAMLKEGPYTQINEALIAAQGDPVSGAGYSFADAPDYGTYYYKLEDVDLYGMSTLHGPVRVTVARPLRRPLYRPRLPEF